ncbi:sterol desaturase family protein [Porifericola rhodea]|uniref:sterol desaturase family protein n=1 Tax=Porifericola rhodea TaxID=930972 RepID=UPI00266589C1|nr:sterol desaturase family protein [Porifericola rhodea]WKN30589.1 sterol desaturase family protein [Porifericola rhodea]
MNVLSSIVFFLLGFVGMEFFSWFIHKYIMHGPLWSIHKTHHTATKGFFELNDVFSLIFGTAAVVLIILGVNSLDYRFWLGLGITAYGFSYFLLHDILIHRRIKSKQKPSGKYWNGIAKAHRDHHKSNQRDGSVSFGLLIVPFKYFSKRK